MGDICLLGNTSKWNTCLNKNPCLHKTTMGTNKKIVYICIHLFDFHLLVLHPLSPTIDARIAWAKEICEIIHIYFAQNHHGEEH